MANIRDGKHLQIQEMLSSDTYKLMKLFNGRIDDKALSPYYKTGKLAEFKLEKLEETEKSSRFKVIIKTTENKKFTDKIDLIKEEGEWKISNF